MQIGGFSTQSLNPLHRQLERERREPVAEPAALKAATEQSRQQQSLRENSQSASTPRNVDMAFDSSLILASQRIDGLATVNKNQTHRIQNEAQLPRQNQLAAKSYQSTQELREKPSLGYGELSGIDVIV